MLFVNGGSDKMSSQKRKFSDVFMQPNGTGTKTLQPQPDATVPPKQRDSHHVQELDFTSPDWGSTKQPLPPSHRSDIAKKIKQKHNIERDQGTSPNTYHATLSKIQAVENQEIYTKDAGSPMRSASKKRHIFENDNSEKHKITERQQLASNIPDILPRTARFTGLGFVNFTGAECYRSSVMQSLCHTVKFVNFLLDNHEPKDCLKEKLDIGNGKPQLNCILCFVRHMITSYWAIEGRSVDERSRQKSINDMQVRVNKTAKKNGFRTDEHDRGDFRSNGQGDPNDFLNWLLNELPNTVPSPNPECLKGICNVAYQQIIFCQGCKYKSKTSPEDRGMPLAMTSSRDAPFEAYVDAYMEDKVHGYKCENCATVSTKRRLRQIVSAPNVLTVTLQRYSMNPRNGRTEKDHRQIPYPAILDLTSRCAENIEGVTKYELYSVVCHIGGDNSGHYFSYCKQPGTNKWHKFDDELVTNSSLSSALNPPSRATPYLLWYSRIL